MSTLAGKFAALFDQINAILSAQDSLADVPAIGDALPGLPTGLFGSRVQAIVDALTALPADASLAQMRDTINANGAGFVSAAIEGDKLRLMVVASAQTSGAPVTTEFSVGGTSLGFAAQIGFSPSFTQSLRLDLLFDPATGDLAYVDRPGDEITITLSADFSLTGGAHIGPLTIGLEDVHVGPEATISLGLNLPTLSLETVTANLTGSVDVRNRITLDLGDDLPSVQGDLVVQWQLGGGGAPSPLVEFADVKIKLGDLLAAVAQALQPIYDLFATTPFKQFYEALTAPLPIVDEGIKLLGQVGEFDLVPGPAGDGRISALDLIAHSLKVNGDPKYEAVVAFTGVVHLLRQIDELKAAGADLGDAFISLGSFRLTDDPNNPFASLATAEELAGLRAAAQQAVGTAFDLANDLAAAVGDDLKIGDQSIGSYLQGIADVTGTTARTGIYFPIIENPSEILKFIFPGAFPADQRNAEFFRVDIIENFAHDDEQFFGYGPFVFNLTQKLFAGIDLSVGYDSFGLLPSNSLKDGLFVRGGRNTQDNPHAADGAAAYLDFQFSAGAGVGVAVGGIGVGALIEGGISGDRISLFLRDGGYRPFVGGPVFDGVSGKITAKLNALFKVDLLLGSITHREPLLQATIIDFGEDRIADNMGLASELTAGVPPGLYLNAGVRFDQRRIVGADGTPIPSSNLDNDEVFTLANAPNGRVKVFAFGILEEYGAPGGIVYADMGQGDDGLGAAPNFAIRMRAAGNSGDDFLTGGAADDVLYGDSDGDADPTQVGNDVLVGGAGNDVLRGGPGDDLLDGGEGQDLMVGGTGHDTVSYEKAGGAVLISPEVTFDPRSLIGGAAAAGDTLIEIEQIIGSSYADSISVGRTANGGGYVLDGRGGDDSLQGGDGDDVLIGGAGADSLRGGAGRDFVSYLASTVAVQIDLAANTASGGEAAGDTFDSIEMIQGSLHGDFLGGDGGDNILDGLDGNDILASRGGEDVLLGGNGDDIVYAGLDGGLADGGLDRDLLSFEQVLAAGVTVNLLSSQGPGGLVIAPAVELDPDPDTGIFRRGPLGLLQTRAVPGRSSFEDLTGSNQADFLSGDDGDNVIRGLAGIDVVRGGLGNDTIYGGDGADELYGESGDDVIFTGAGSDLAELSPNAAGGSADGGEGNDTITGGTGANLLHGGEGDDTLRGETGNDTLHGGAGDDLLDGGADDDAIYGGTGHDRVAGGDGNDTLRGEAGNDVIAAGAGDDEAQGGDDNDLITGGAGADTLQGGAGDDALDGSEEGDTLYGGDGQDHLAGGSGADLLHGDAGDDIIFGDRRVFVAVHDNENDSLGGDADLDLRKIGSWTEANQIEFRIDTGPRIAAGAILTIEATDIDYDGTRPADEDEFVVVLLNGHLLGHLSGTRSIGASGDILSDVKTTASFAVPSEWLDPDGNNLIQVRDVATFYNGRGVFSVDRATLVFDLGAHENGEGGDDSIFGGSGSDRIYGGEGGDDVDGGDGSDILYGDSRDPLHTGGDDRLTGGAGDDELIGGYGSDILDAGTGKFKVYGGTFLGLNSSGEELWAESLADGDTLIVDQSDYAGEFYRLRWGYFSAPTGDFGRELRISWSGQGSADSAFDPPSTARGVSGVVYYGGVGRDLIGFSELQGTLDSNTVHLGTIDDPLNGGPGDDELHGGGGSDELFGGRGSDRLYGDDGRDLLFGGAGDDWIETGAGADFVGSAITIDYRFWDPVWRADGGIGNDTLIGGADNNVLFGNEGDDALYGMGGNDILIGELTTSSGALTVTGNDLIHGGDGDDYIDPGLGVETIDGGAGTDRLFINRSSTELGVSFFLNGPAGSDGTTAVNIEILTYWAGSGDDRVAGSSGNDSIEGRGGNDILHGHEGRDTLLGGDGDDQLFGGDGIDVLQGGAGDDWIETGGGSEFAFGSVRGGNAEGGSGNDTIIGDNESNQLFGEDGDDVLYGMGGDDLLVGGAGANTLIGGDGNDNMTASAGKVVADGGNGLDRLTVNRIAASASVTFYSDGTVGSDGSSAINIEFLEYYGGSGHDTVIGGDSLAGFDFIDGRGGDDWLGGGNGRDTLFGGDGNDHLDGGLGADRLDGGAGDDIIVVDDAGDQVFELLNGGTDTVRASISYVLPAEVEHLILTAETAAINGAGNAKANEISGNDGDNLLSGLGGTDTLFGGLGADRLDGGAGADRMEGGEGDDVMIVDDADDLTVELPDEGYDSVETSVSYTLSDNLEKLILTGAAAIDGVGNDGDNELVGNSGDNGLDGGGGDDRITGGAGDDVLHGGAGIDTAVFSGTIDDYSITEVGGVVEVIDLRANGDGTDRIEGVEFFAFADDTYSLAAALNPPPTAAGDLVAGLVEAKAGAPGIAATTGNVLANDSTATASLAVTGIGRSPASLEFVASTAVVAGFYGTLTIGADGAFSYALDNGRSSTDKLNDGEIGSEIFTYRITDANGRSAFAEFRIDIQGVTDAIQPGDDLLVVTAGRPTAFDAALLLLNDSVIGYGAIEVVALLNVEASGTFELADGSLWITAADGSGAFDYEVAGPGGSTAYGYVAVRALTATPGDDFLVAPDAATAAVLDGGEGHDWLRGGANADVLIGGAGFDGLEGGDGDDLLDGGDDGDYLSGSGGFDLLLGGLGSDYLEGGAGADRMEGGDGDDYYVVDDAGDQVIELPGEGYDYVASRVSIVLPEEVEELYLVGAGDIDGTGNDLANLIYGNGGNNRLTGGGSDDVLIADDGDDILTGDDGDDYLDGGNGADILEGGSGADYLEGGAGADHLSGGEGDDELLGGDDDDWLDGGKGRDTLSYRDAASGVALSLAITTAQNTGGSGFDTVSGFEKLVGSSFNDTLTGDAGGNRIEGGAGDDVMDGGLGEDTAAYEFATSGVTVSLSVAGAQNTGGAGIDTLSNFEHLDGSDFNDQLTGNAGNNVLDGRGGADVMWGLGGNDTYLVDDAGDVADESGGGGFDRVFSSVSYTLGAGIENLYLTGIAAINGTGNASANSIFGNAAANRIDGGGGGDQMRGGDGDDTYVVDHVMDRVVEAAGGGNDTIESSISLALFGNVENLTLTGTANTYAMGNALDNLLIGNSGNNVLNGKAGADRMRGGAGNDIYVVDDAGDLVEETSAAHGTDLVKASVSHTLTAFVEQLELVGTENINGTGNALANKIVGNAGNNVLDGGAGADEMKGFAGDDTYVVDNSGDRILEVTNHGYDTVRSTISYTLGANLEELVLLGTAALNGTGNALDNVLIGNVGANVLNGGAGADTMRGGDGNDTYIVDHVGDRVEEASALGGHDTVRSSVSFELGENVEELRLIGSAHVDGTGNAAANTIVGNTGSNTLDGGAGDDTLSGSAGDDVLHGGLGADTLHGGGGMDKFVFDTALGESNIDTIVDMLAAHDSIVLDHAVFAGLGPGFLSVDAFTTGTAATTADHRIIYDRTTGALFYDADGVGGADAVQFATISNAPPGLSASDFLVI